MDRNEILKKAQAGNTGMDEREQQALGGVLRLRRHSDGAAVRRAYRLAAGMRPGRL